MPVTQSHSIDQHHLRAGLRSSAGWTDRPAGRPWVAGRGSYRGRGSVPRRRGRIVLELAGIGGPDRHLSSTAARASALPGGAVTCRGPVLPYRPSHCRPACAVLVPSLRFPLSWAASTPPPCGAVAGSAGSSSSRRAFTRSRSHRDSGKENCSRWTAGHTSGCVAHHQHRTYPAASKVNKLPVTKRQYSHTYLDSF